MSAPRPQVAASALRLALSHSSARPGQFVCHACRRHATRPLHTSQPRLAERPWHQRMTESLFGSKESRDAEKARAEKREKKAIEAAQDHKANEALRRKAGKVACYFLDAAAGATYTPKGNEQNQRRTQSQGRYQRG